MPKSRHTSAIGSPSKRRATKQRRSSTTELSFHAIHTSRLQKSEKCNPCVRYEVSPMSQAAQCEHTTTYNKSADAHNSAAAAPVKIQSRALPTGRYLIADIPPCFS